VLRGGFILIKGTFMHRLRTILILCLTCILILACNLPFKVVWRGFKPYPTLDPSIFYHATATMPIEEFITPTVTPTPLPVNPQQISYNAQSGDILAVVAAHFGVAAEQITSPQPLPPVGLIPAGQQLILPRTEANSTTGTLILPDSAVVNSPCAQAFDTSGFIANTNGYLKYYQQLVYEEQATGAEVVARAASNASVDPRLLLAFIEFRSGWVTANVGAPNLTYPLGLNRQYYEGLFRELSLVTQWLNTGYYGWREGTLSAITYADGRSSALAPNLNAGSVGILYLFAQLYPLDHVDALLYGEGGFLSIYKDLFGDPLTCAAQVEPLFPPDLQLPELELPFAAGERWSFTAGPHPDWVPGTPMGALDFAPVTGEAPCSVSRAWARASAAGVVTRSSNSVVLVALEDGNGALTGWELMYMHLADKDRVLVGTRLKAGDPLGHPSCEGGPATGTHVHITRKYRGEWIGISEVFPLALSGWQALPGEAVYKGMLVKGESVVTAHANGSSPSIIVR